MRLPGRVAVVDVGKTNAKVALVDAETWTEIEVATVPNRVVPGPPWPHHDLDTLWEFVVARLGDLHRRRGVDAISVTAHGAALALLNGRGGLAAPMLDYEHSGPDGVAAGYDAVRPGFAETGSPRLPGGLNAGAQLHWQLSADPGLRRRVAKIVTYPQYWGYRLTGEACCDVTSLGCHTDLWNPGLCDWSSLPGALGLVDAFAPARLPGEILGCVRADVADETGIPRDTEVAVGIHDSNASLLPHLGTDRPFSVISSGTWVIAMCIGAAARALDPARDTLVNVDAFGNPVPSARFMGGREYELAGGRGGAATDADLEGALASGALLLPSVVGDSGPFQGLDAAWTGDKPLGGALEAALAFYLAKMSATCLELAGHRGRVLVEGPLARSPGYLDMLAAASGSGVSVSESATGTSIGAAMLLVPDDLRPKPAARQHVPRLSQDALRERVQRWQDAVESRRQACGT